ncbi:MAG: hypothetical protein KA385_12615 [Vicinamibacteria bacterium]|nr:hypothetical protein [Vicinamibacteria bacterium]
MLAALCSSVVCGQKPEDTADDSGTSTATSTADTTPTSTDGTTTQGEEPAVCTCIDDVKFGNFSFTCSPLACFAVIASCDVEQGVEEAHGCEGIGGAFSVDEFALECSLLHLKSGTEGTLMFDLKSNGPVSQGGFIQILPNRQGLVRTWESHDLSGVDSPAGVVNLKDAAYFGACLEEQDLGLRLNCFRAWSDEQPSAQCDGEGFM